MHWSELMDFSPLSSFNLPSCVPSSFCELSLYSFNQLFNSLNFLLDFHLYGSKCFFSKCTRVSPPSVSAATPSSFHLRRRFLFSRMHRSDTSLINCVSPGVPGDTCNNISLTRVQWRLLCTHVQTAKWMNKRNSSWCFAISLPYKVHPPSGQYTRILTNCSNLFISP